MISNCLIMGCARSGTSMMAGIFKNNYYVGNDNYPPRPANPKGFFEGPYLNDTNNIILNATAGVCADWWVMPLPLECPEIVCPPQAVERIENLVSREPFCYKDPRFCYSLPAWIPYLKNTKYICMFRHPALSIRSLMIENQRSAESCAEIQTSMYRHVLNRTYTGNMMFVHYDQLFDPDKIKSIEKFLGAKADYCFPETKYRKTLKDIEPTEVPNEYLEIYMKLCELAGAIP